MKLKRAKLIELIDAEIARREQVEADKYVRAMEKYRRSEEEWLEQYRQAWLDFALAIETAISHGDAVTATLRPESLTKGYSNTLPFFKEDYEPAPQKAYLGDLLAMRGLLESVLDAEVTTAELSRLGFKVPSLFRKE